MVNDSIASRVFGATSTLVEAQVPAEGVSTYVDELMVEPLYVLVASMFALVYLMWLPYVVRNRGVKWSRLIRASQIQEGEHREVVSKQQTGVVIVSWALGITLLSLYLLRLSAQFLDAAEPLEWGVLLPLSVAAVVFVMMYSWVALKLGGYFTLQPEFVEQINTLKLQILFFMVILLSPLFVLSSFATLEQGQLILQLSVLVLVVLVLVFVRHSFLLFMRQNFSILHWILYLCGVEILPLTFLWAVVVRSYGFGI